MAKLDYDLNALRVTKSVAELTDLGQQLRQRVGFKQLGTYQPTKRKASKLMNRVQKMLVPELLPMRHERMSASIFAFFRGTAELMDYDLQHQPSSGIWTVICGDAHLGNFGFYASPERHLLFDLNDFDEARIGPWEWDLKRLLVSIALAARVSGFKEKKVEKLLTDAAANYRDGLKTMLNRSALSRFYTPRDVGSLLDRMPMEDEDAHLLGNITEKAQKRDSEQVVRKFTETTKSGKLKFKENAPRTVHISKEKYQLIKTSLLEYLQTVRTDVALLLSQYKVTDIVRHSVGVGSFGSLCYLILMTGLDGSHIVLQIKEALPTRRNGGQNDVDLTAAREYTEGRRITDCQKILQSASDPFLGYFKTTDKSFYVRQFRDMKESVDIASLDWRQFKAYACVCAWLLAADHTQSPTAPMIDGYIGDSADFDQAIVQWTRQYEKQVEVDYAGFLA